jgi:CRISPR-associated endonuclease/helicase Cas3
MTSLHRYLWAKSDPHHPLWCHLLDVAAVCRAVLPHFGGLPELPDSWVCLIAGLHDTGKADPYFQNKEATLAADLRVRGLPVLEEQLPFRHERRSAQWVNRWLKDTHRWKSAAREVVAAALVGHHGDFTSFDAPVLPPAEAAIWAEFRRELTDLLVEMLEVPPLSLSAFEHAGVAGLRLSGLVVLSDWIASNDELYRYPSLDRELPPKYFAAACQEAERAVTSLAFNARTASPAGSEPVAFQGVFPDFTLPRRVQLGLEELVAAGAVPPGLVLIEDQMGEGKSEAALYLIECWSGDRGRCGAYLALPTAATSNQMYRRYARFLESRSAAGPAPRLVHGMAWLADDTTPTMPSQTFGEVGEGWTAREWFRNTRRALLAPEAVGTIDQALMSVLHVRFGFLRFLGLSTKTLLVDEVHAYDEYMTVLLEQLLRWCWVLRIPVVLLSATLSNRQKERLLQAFGGSLPEAHREEYPLVTVAPFDGNATAHPIPLPDDRNGEPRCAPSRAIDIQVVRHPGLLENPAEIAALAADVVRDGGCACVLVSTVTTAQQVFETLRRPGAAPETDLLLFHARFRAGERARREKEVVGRFGKDAGRDGNPPRPRRAILVATQVVEQSLDVDFDVLLTEIAPIDLLLQRCGRLHRHPQEERHGHAEPVVHVFLPQPDTPRFGRTARVYETLEPLVRTYAVLQKVDAFHLPGDFRTLIGQVYDGAPLPEGVVDEQSLREAAKKRVELDRAARDEALKHLLPEPQIDAFPLTRLSVEEDEEGTAEASYFRARTRLGDPTVRLLLVNDGRAEALFRSDQPPHRRVLQWLLQQQVTVPYWWLQGALPAQGFAEPADAPRWLRGYRYLRLRDRKWRGVRNGSPLLLIDDPDLGVRLTKDEVQEDDTAV